MGDIGEKQGRLGGKGGERGGLLGGMRYEDRRLWMCRCTLQGWAELLWAAAGNSAAGNELPTVQQDTPWGWMNSFGEKGGQAIYQGPREGGAGAFGALASPRPTCPHQKAFPLEKK